MKCRGSTPLPFRYIGLIAMFLTLIACAPSQPSLAPDTYVTVITKDEVPDKFGPPWAPERYPGVMLIGQSELTFTKDGHFIYSRGGFPWGEGEYSVNPSILEFGLDDTCIYEGIESGTYSWTLDGDKLTFERIEDDCEGRAFSLLFKPWIKQ